VANLFNDIKQLINNKKINFEIKYEDYESIAFHNSGMNKDFGTIMMIDCSKLSKECAVIESSKVYPIKADSKNDCYIFIKIRHMKKILNNNFKLSENFG
jgi:hypothetical protein